MAKRTRKSKIYLAGMSNKIFDSLSNQRFGLHIIDNHDINEFLHSFAH